MAPRGRSPQRYQRYHWPRHHRILAGVLIGFLVIACGLLFAQDQATLRISNGGLDANWTVRHKIPTITFGAGQNNVHTVEEYVDLGDFEKGCRLALALATLAD